MKAGKWRTDFPDEFVASCLVTIQQLGGEQCRYVTTGWADTDRLKSQAVAWMPMPAHILVKPDGWFSPYRGDDSPSESGWYLVCQDRHAWCVDRLWYDAAKDTWRAVDPRYGEVIAWRHLPKPYQA